MITVMLGLMAVCAMFVAFEARQLWYEEKKKQTIQRMEARIDELASLIERVGLASHRVVDRVQAIERAHDSFRNDVGEIRFSLERILASDLSPDLLPEAQQLRTEVARLGERLTELESKERAKSDYETRAMNPNMPVEAKG